MNSRQHVSDAPVRPGVRAAPARFLHAGFVAAARLWLRAAAPDVCPVSFPAAEDGADTSGRVRRAAWDRWRSCGCGGGAARKSCSLGSGLSDMWGAARW